MLCEHELAGECLHSLIFRVSVTCFRRTERKKKGVGGGGGGETLAYFGYTIFPLTAFAGCVF